MSTEKSKVACFVLVHSSPKDKGSTDSIKFTGSEIGKQAAAKSKGLFSAEDWMCSKYDFVYSCLFFSN